MLGTDATRMAYTSQRICPGNARNRRCVVLLLQRQMQRQDAPSIGKRLTGPCQEKIVKSRLAQIKKIGMKQLFAHFRFPF